MPEVIPVYIKGESTALHGLPCSLAGLCSLDVWGLVGAGTFPCLLHGNASFEHQFHAWHFQNLLLHKKNSSALSTLYADM